MVDFARLAAVDNRWRDRRKTQGCDCVDRTPDFCYWRMDREPNQVLPDVEKLCKCHCHIVHEIT